MKTQLKINDLENKFKNAILKREMQASIFGGDNEDDQRKKDKNQVKVTP